jgi:hypothetical protein
VSEAVLVPPTATRPVAIPVREVLAWSAFVGALALFLIYLVGYEQGALSLFGGTSVHEWMHDGRHLIAFPCH